jgi:Lon protease-like protein
MQANDLKADWEDIDKAPNEALTNALSMMSPMGAEKQALLEAPT